MNAWMDHYHAQGGPILFEVLIVEIINDIRLASGLQPFTISPTLMMSARFKSQAMTDMGYRGHTNPVYGRFSTIPRQLFGYPSNVYIGENLNRWSRTPAEVVANWMRSEGHRANILRPEYTEIGVGFHQLRWTQHFGGGNTSHLPPPTTAPW